MAFKKVELTKEEEEALANGGDFFKFTAVGQKLLGRFSKTQAQTGQFAKSGRVDYVFKIKKEDGTVGDTVLNPPTRAGILLDSAVKKGLLKPGYAVKLVCTGEQDVGKDSPMKLFDLEIDDAAPKAGAAPPPPPPPPKPEPADDIDF